MKKNNLLVDVKKDSGRLERRIKKLENILYENKGKAVIFKEFFESIAKVESNQKKADMEFDQRLKGTDEKINQSNVKIDDFREELEKYEKQFALLKEDQSNVRDELVKYKQTVVK